MTTNIATTKEQSARLLQCGVSAESADMIETRLGNLLNRTQDFPVDETKETLVWSLSALLGLLPKEVKIHRDGDTLSMIYHCGQWRVGYTNCAEYCNHTKVAPELIDALYSLLVWCLEKGYVKLD